MTYQLDSQSIQEAWSDAARAAAATGRGYRKAGLGKVGRAALRRTFARLGGKRKSGKRTYSIDYPYK